MTLRSVAALVIGGLAVLVTILQIGGAISARRKGRSYSFVPILGALLGAGGCIIAPWRHSAYAIPIFLILDPTPAMFVFLAVRGRLFK
jgi:hypothetical protein